MAPLKARLCIVYAQFINTFQFHLLSFLKWIFMEFFHANLKHLSTIGVAIDMTPPKCWFCSLIVYITDPPVIQRHILQAFRGVLTESFLNIMFFASIYYSVALSWCRYFAHHHYFFGPILRHQILSTLYEILVIFQDILRSLMVMAGFSGVSFKIFSKCYITVGM